VESGSLGKVVVEVYHGDRHITRLGKRHHIQDYWR
jgi:hypothetical protein